jgi:hypothetical protein
MTDKAKAAFVATITIIDALLKEAVERQRIINNSQHFKWLGFKQPQGRCLYHEATKFNNIAANS